VSRETGELRGVGGGIEVRDEGDGGFTRLVVYA